MKTIKRGCDRPIFQGDLMITRVAKIPGNLDEVKSRIVAHSETGHHHVAERAVVFSGKDAMKLFFKAIGKSVDIVHKRPYDTHETIRLLTKPGDVFQVTRQKEWAPEGWRRVED